MKRRYLNILLILGIIAGAGAVYYFYTPLNKSLTRGYEYLRSSYKNYSYNDFYLNYRYSNETLKCPAAGCELSYRLLDAYFNVIMLNNAGASASQLGNQLSDARSVLSGIIEEWRSGGINNTLKSEGNEAFALDTYCILGFLHEDEKMSETVKRYLGNSGWLTENYYQDDIWRNIADETWCLRLLIKKTNDYSKLVPVIQRQILETNALLVDSELINQQAVLYHMAIMMSEAEASGLPVNEMAVILSAYQNRLIAVTLDQELWQQPLSLANTLDALLSIKANEDVIIHKLADKLISLQQKDGAWLPQPEAKQGQVFTTMRALLALTKYRKYLNEN